MQKMGTRNKNMIQCNLHAILQRYVSVSCPSDSILVGSVSGYNQRDKFCNNRKYNGSPRIISALYNGYMGVIMHIVAIQSTLEQDNALGYATLREQQVHSTPCLKGLRDLLVVQRECRHGKADET